MPLFWRFLASFGSAHDKIDSKILTMSAYDEFVFEKWA